MTPLFLVLLIIEFTDLIFAVDSIPAIFSVTKDPYIVFFSNIFAIIGLRSMFFLLANIVDKFKYLKTGLAFLLTFIGLKMIFHHQLEDWGFKTTHSLLIILGILGTSIAASLISSSTAGKRSKLIIKAIYHPYLSSYQHQQSLCIAADISVYRIVSYITRDTGMLCLAVV